MIGLFVDGWAHTNLTELETFFTPWHGLFYSGFTATALWITWMIRKRILAGNQLATAIPPGYKLAAVGLVLFALGGVGDGIWHTVLGIETGVDALISPTHILLFLGIVFIVGAPMRAVAEAHPGRSLPKGEFLPVGMSMGLMTMIISFFFMYTYAPSTGVPSVALTDHSGSFEAEFGIMQMLLSTVILTGAMLYLAERWNTPMFTFTVIFGFLGVLFQGMLDEFSQPWEIVTPIAGGLAADLFIRRYRPTPRSVIAWPVLGAVMPLTMWSVYMITFSMFRDLRWPPELWAGSVVLTMMVGLGLAHLLARSSSDTPESLSPEPVAAGASGPGPASD